uniref:Uncharacterized protein n=1 Tax=Strix occidentalis caurina TaxID=311401 RepID=A0A8D0F1E4_STROC
MEHSEGGEQSQQQQQPWGKLIRLGADEAEPHVLLKKINFCIFYCICNCLLMD